MSENEWLLSEKNRLSQKVLEMKIGHFHEDLMGKFLGYETLAKGHKTCCDVQKKDETVVIEVKNRNNTIKGSDGKHTIALLKSHKDAGKKAILVQINCPNGKVNKYGNITDIDIWNGKQIYTYLSGRDSFFDDLLFTVNYTFFNFNSVNLLKSALKIF